MFRGQSVAEYGLVGVLVLLVSIGALSGLSSIFNNKLSHTIKQYAWDGSTGTLVKSSTLVSIPSNLNPILSSQSSNFSTVSALPTVAATIDPSSPLASGTIEGVKQFLNSNPGQLVETAGSSGYTSQMAYALKIIANELQSQGTASPATLSQVAALANQGYKMAQIQQLIEKAWFDSGKNIDVYAETTIPFEGTNYSVFDLAKKIDGDPGNPSASGPDTVKLLNLFTKLEESGEIRDSSTLNLIASLKQNIVVQSDTLHNNATFDLTAGNNSGYSLNDIKAVGTFSIPTQQDSTNICTTGSRTSDGMSCH